MELSWSRSEPQWTSNRPRARERPTTTMRLTIRSLATACLLALPALFSAQAPVSALGAQTLGPADGHDLPRADLERVAVGGEAPNFTLESFTGESVELAGYRGAQNVVLVFYRGHW